VVLAGQDVVVARALANGDVVVALASGVVEVLSPNGAGLSVVENLQAQGGVPSAVAVLQTASGLQVLVSSQGSDTIFVFTAAGAATGPTAGGVGLAPILESNGPISEVNSQSIQTGQQVAVAAGQLASAPPTGLVSSTLSSTGSTTTATLGGSSSGGSVASAASGSLGSAAGLSLGNLGSPTATSTVANGAAVLVPVQGNSYATVAVFDFGSQTADDSDSGGRMPWLSLRYALGDTSPLMRFVIGQLEALQRYLASRDARLNEDNEAPLRDPWNEDLFYRRPIVPRPPIRDQEEDELRQPGDPEAFVPDATPDLRQRDRTAPDCFWEKCADDPRLLPPAAGASAGPDLADLAVVLAGVLLPAPWLARADRSESDRQARKSFAQSGTAGLY
jgi:hypothetical protein